MTDTELNIIIALAAGILVAVVAVAVLRIMRAVEAIREVNDAWYAEVTDEPAPRLFDRLAADEDEPIPFEVWSGPLDQRLMDALRRGVAEAEAELMDGDPEAPEPVGFLNVTADPVSEDAEPDPLNEPAPSAPVEAPAVNEPPDELPDAERPCGGTHKNHKYVDAQGTRQADCIRCGSPDRALPKKVTTRAPRAPKPAEPVADPVGAHVSGPATSKASTTGRTRAERRGGAAGELSIQGTQKETSTAPATVIEDASRDFCPRGHGRFLVTNDEYGDPDPHCITCGARPLAENAEELMREATEPREGAQRRREPRTAGMRI